MCNYEQLSPLAKLPLFIQLFNYPPIYIYIYIRGAYDKFPDFFRMGTFIYSTHMKL